ncbi:hypothetical protein RRF57_011805 [Xylaria bambusicola]|uniref:Uncharacterized protein n=1 Tax=Xylaria bambusicola TaxID=326684 RepID=A0AAN7V4Z0_9PEZI
MEHDQGIIDGFADTLDGELIDSAVLARQLNHGRFPHTGSEWIVLGRCGGLARVFSGRNPG